MRLALMSDIHANMHAFTACLAHAKAQGVRQWALLGDLVGYGAQPQAVVEQAMALAAEGAVVLQGNHDAMAVMPQLAGQDMGSSTAAWTHAQLSEAQRQFLAQRPLQATLGTALLVHASAQSPEKWIYVDTEHKAQLCLEAASTQTQRHVFVGHVHHQGLYYAGAGRGVMKFVPTPGVAVPLRAHRTFVATVGSVGQPRDGDPRAMYAIYDAPAQKLTFHRVAYDQHAAAEAIRRAGLPEFFAQRLEDGR
jgi:diadenosine tetraphosphatase ApaH/serine/threonine PP2A family protein phosphatase